MEPPRSQQRWESDVETAFAALFVLTVVLPPAAIVAGVIALALGSRRRDVARIRVEAPEVMAH